ncbi:hypothetical protein HPP92_007329 [Vanilla planifolia]|nr:hypothetical protein HPP92_007329 [Vanilla planifolia]
MLTGSISAIRFGLILGSILFAFSISSLRSWKSGQPSRLSLIGQADAIFIKRFIGSIKVAH